MKIIKNIFYWLLYFFSIILGLFASNSLQEQDIVPTLIFCFLTLSTYVFLIKKEFLNKTSYISYILFLIFIWISLDTNIDTGHFVSVEAERIFFVIFGFLSSFTLIFFNHLIKIQDGFQKKLSSFIIILTVFLLFLFGTSVPNFHNNFIYTRISIGIIFLFSILHRKKKLFLIGGIIVSIIALLLSSALFIAEVYDIQGKEKEAVLSFIDPKIQNMFQSYNQKGVLDFTGFTEDFGQELKFMILQDAQNIQNQRDQNGQYVSNEEPTITFYAGFYHIVYPIYFENLKNPLYYDFLLTGIKSDDTIYGFSVSQN